jgi:hypothetical protein
MWTATSRIAGLTFPVNTESTNDPAFIASRPQHLENCASGASGASAASAWSVAVRHEHPGERGSGWGVLTPRMTGAAGSASMSVGTRPVRAVQLVSAVIGPD